MAKGKDDPKGKTESKVAIAIALDSEETENVLQIPPDIKHIRITLQAYTNITRTFSFSDLTVQARFMETDLGTSSKTQATDEDYFPAHHEFVIECDINSSKNLDDLISNPVIFKVFENPGQVDAELMAKLGSPPKSNLEDAFLMSAESVADLAEAFTGKAVDRSAFLSSEASSGKASKKDSKKDAQKSKSDTKNSKTKMTKDDKEKQPVPEFPTEPVLLGTTTLDLLPLFLGNTKFTETVLVPQPQKFYDDRMVPLNIMPRLVVEVAIDENTWLEENVNGNILSLTIESVYNLPTLMSDVMQYKVSTVLPSAFAKWEPVVIGGGKLKEQVDKYRLKRWPGVVEDSTKYRIDECVETIKNKLGLNLTVLNSKAPRIEWNTLKRNLLMEEATREFFKKLKKYRHLSLELYVTSAKEEVMLPDTLSPQKTDTKGNVKSEASSKSDKGKKGKGPEKGPKKEVEDYLHLMTAIDVSTLLYPGVKRCRVVCPLNTFQEKEIFEQAGLVNSYFMHKSEEHVPSSAGADKAKASKSEKGSKKGVKTPGDESKNNLKPLLPSPPVIVLEPSTPVYSEEGERTFILIEIELLKPLVPQRDIDDLSERLLQLLPKRPTMSKIIVSSRLAQLHFKDMIKQLTEDLIQQHEHYIKEKEQCDKYGAVNPQANFLTFLQRSGVYQTYLLSVTKAATVVVNDKFPYLGETSHNNKDYQNFIAETYSSLIKETNTILNELTSSGVEAAPVSPLMGLDPLLLYAREAFEIGAITLADRYYLERICKDDKNPNCWFDYAIFQLETGDKEKALECAKQCLIIDAKHQYSLLLCGILLAEKNLDEEAETCLLTAMFQNQCWLEGWGTVHLFYSNIGNREGADLCMEMANRCLKNYSPVADYFVKVDDLAWTAAMCPQTVFYRTAILLLKMRTFTFAEKALACEKMKTGVYHYYLAVITYYRHNYLQSLEHLREAEQLQGSDYAIASLKGHCFLALEDLQNAKEEYLRVLESFNRPEDMHLLQIYLALILERIGNKQFSRKLLLLTCKFSPTPYTWLATGLLYYGQRDLISAEQCLIQANWCDNRLPEVWSYLVLINLDLHHYSEAELCYKQAKKIKMGNPTLARRIESAMKFLIKK